MFIVQAETENGIVAISTADPVYAQYLCDSMAEDFGRAVIYENENPAPVYDALVLQSA